MTKKEAIQIRARIPDSKIWESFINHVQNKHGKTYGVIGLELQKVLTKYLENPKPVNFKEKEEKYEKELQNAHETISKLKKLHGNEIKKLEQRVTVAEALSKQAERLKKINQEKEKEIITLKKEREYLQAVQERNDQLQNQQDKLRNKFDHLQERFNKSQNELNVLERENSGLRVVVAKVGKLSFWERVLNRLPSEVKELEGENG